jgi:hypothetical protein
LPNIFGTTLYFCLSSWNVLMSCLLVHWYGYEHVFHIYKRTSFLPDICNSSVNELSELKYDLKGLLEIQNNRKKRLKNICHDVNRNLPGFHGLNTRKLDHIISVDQQQLLYCYVPKVRVFLDNQFQPWRDESWT